MNGERALRALAEKALLAAGGDQAEATLIASTTQLSRFANSAIHQNVVNDELTLRLRVVSGGRVATQTTNRLDDEGIRALAASATALTAIVPEDANFRGLPEARPIAETPSAFVARTADATPEDRALAVKRVCDLARAAGLRAAGLVSTNTQELAVANSLGTWAYAPQTVAELQVIAMGDSGSAFAQRLATDVDALGVEDAASEAIAKAVRTRAPRDLAPGAYEVVLDPYAAYDIAMFLGMVLTGPALEDGRSFVGGRFGERVTGRVTLVDDPFDPHNIPRAFDFEGQPSEQLALIENGIARAVVYDSRTAQRTGARNTGHAMPPGNLSVFPMHMRLEPGDRSRDDLIRSVKRGVLVTRFWYTRWVHPLKTVVTGMTRDGTFAIEDGEIAYPVKNLRFTQSYHEALEGTRGIGKDLTLLGDGGQFGVQSNAARVPALHLASFNFTGATQY